MKKFKFSLEKVLVYKNQLLDREKGVLAQLQLDRNAIEQAIERCRQDFSTVNDDMAEKSSKGINVRELRQIQYQLDSLRQEIKRLQDEKEELQKQIDKQIEVVLLMTQEVSGLEKLKEQQLEAYNKEEMKATELEISEYVSGKLIRGDTY